MDKDLNQILQNRFSKIEVVACLYGLNKSLLNDYVIFYIFKNHLIDYISEDVADYYCKYLHSDYIYQLSGLYLEFGGVHGTPSYNQNRDNRTASILKSSRKRLYNSFHSYSGPGQKISINAVELDRRRNRNVNLLLKLTDPDFQTTTGPKIEHYMLLDMIPYISLIPVQSILFDALMGRNICHIVPNTVHLIVNNFPFVYVHALARKYQEYWNAYMEIDRFPTINAITCNVSTRVMKWWIPRPVLFLNDAIIFEEVPIKPNFPLMGKMSDAGSLYATQHDIQEKFDKVLDDFDRETETYKGYTARGAPIRERFVNHRQLVSLIDEEMEGGRHWRDAIHDKEIEKVGGLCKCDCTCIITRHGRYCNKKCRCPTGKCKSSDHIIPNKNDTTIELNITKSTKCNAEFGIPPLLYHAPTSRNDAVVVEEDGLRQRRGFLF